MHACVSSHLGRSVSSCLEWPYYASCVVSVGQCLQQYYSLVSLVLLPGLSGNLLHTLVCDKCRCTACLLCTQVQAYHPTPLRLDWIEQCFTSTPTQYTLYGRRFLQVKRPNQQYQSTEGTNSTQTNQTYTKQVWTLTEL